MCWSFTGDVHNQGSRCKTLRLKGKTSTATQSALTHLQDLLHSTGDSIVLVTNDGCVEHAGGGVQGVHSGVNAQLSNATRQHSGGIQVSKGGGGCRICQIICRHVNSLHNEVTFSEHLSGCPHGGSTQSKVDRQCRYVCNFTRVSNGPGYQGLPIAQTFVADACFI